MTLLLVNIYLIGPCCRGEDHSVWCEEVSLDCLHPVHRLCFLLCCCLYFHWSGNVSDSVCVCVCDVIIQYSPLWFSVFFTTKYEFSDTQSNAVDGWGVCLMLWFSVQSMLRVVVCRIVYILSAVFSPIFGFLIDRLGKNVFWGEELNVNCLSCNGLYFLLLCCIQHIDTKWIDIKHWYQIHWCLYFPLLQ